MLLLALVLIGLGLLAASLSAGLFFAFSSFVMAGLGAAPPLAAIEGMRGINGAVRNAGFAFAFFGPLVLAPAAALAAWGAGLGAAAVLALGAGLAYALLVFAVTLGVNIPLNQGLDRARPTEGDAASIWAAYAGPWTRWNHLRSAGAVLTSALLAASLVVASRAAGGLPAP